MRKNIAVATSRREELVDITTSVQGVVSFSKVENGLIVLYVQGGYSRFDDSGKLG
jgi:thiamine phosphate synthase YjbQ (UPF0047 family)